MPVREVENGVGGSARCAPTPFAPIIKGAASNNRGVAARKPGVAPRGRGSSHRRWVPGPPRCWAPLARSRRLCWRRPRWGLRVRSCHAMESQRPDSRAEPASSKKRPSGAESWPHGLTLDSVADMSTSLSALSSTVISTFLSRVALQLEVIELRHQVGSSGARSLPTLACTKLALQDLAAGRQREKQHDTLNRLWPSPFGPTR